MSVGRKNDTGKPRTDLLPPRALLEVADVLRFGAQTYGDNNWHAVPDAESRYIGAALRHILAHMTGEQTDAQSGLPHLAHATCSLLFMLELATPCRDSPPGLTPEEFANAKRLHERAWTGKPAADLAGKSGEER